MIYIMKLTIIQRYFAPFMLIGVFAFTPFIAGAQDASVPSMFFPDLSTKGNSSIKEIDNPNLFLNSVLPDQTLTSISTKNENYIKYLEQKITGDAVIDVTHSDDFE